MGIIFDLDQTIIDSSVAKNYRDRRDWNKVYELIPHMIMFDGIDNLITELHNKNVAIAIVTSSPRAYCDRILKYFNIKNVYTVCYHDTTLHKPNPQPILKAIELIGESKENIISVGDDENDIIASKRAGIISCLASWGRDKTSITFQPDYSFQTVNQFIEFIFNYTKERR